MIEQLPIHIANQIAAGEVVQRGASIVKELIENAVDAGATRITIKVEDGGRNLIQVVDNGSGMSPEDSTKAFLRHATSKIRTAEDLFALRTFGFRGEALASIASVAEVELITRREVDELATRVVVRDGVEVERDLCGAGVGTSITVRNLFYSIPARRKFLKGEKYEARLCRTEFVRVAMINEGVAFEYIDSASSQPTILPIQNRHSRIIALTRSSYAKHLLPISVDSPLVKISGYIGSPDTAKANGRADQYLFVNGRYFKNPRLFRSICGAYDRLIKSDTAPSYFIYLHVEEDRVDVNISPTKTEIRFEDEDVIEQILSSAVRQTLGKHNVVEVIDFTPQEIEIPSYTPERKFATPPSFTPKSDYNPFEYSTFENEAIPEDFDEQRAHFDEGYIMGSNSSYSMSSGVDSSSFSSLDSPSLHGELRADIEYTTMQIEGNKYLAVDTVGGLVVVNIARARMRVEYEKILCNASQLLESSQLLALGCTVELSAAQKIEVLSNMESFEHYGFKIDNGEGSTIKIVAMPSGFTVEDFIDLLEEGVTIDPRERIALLATQNILKQNPVKLSEAERSSLFDRLMACEEPSYTPTGLKIMEVIDDIEKRFKR